MEIAPFDAAHIYPKGKEPAAEHPPAWPPMTKRRCVEVDGLAVCVYSTERREDGWSYNVVEQRDEPRWVGYYHHLQSGARIRAANSGNAINLALLLDAL